MGVTPGGIFSVPGSSATSPAGSGAADSLRDTFGVWLAASANRAVGWVAVIELLILCPQMLLASVVRPVVPPTMVVLSWAVILLATVWLAYRAHRRAPAFGPVRLIYFTTLVVTIDTVVIGLTGPAGAPDAHAWAVTLCPPVAALCFLGWRSPWSVVAGGVLAALYGMSLYLFRLPGQTASTSVLEAVSCFVMVLATVAASVGLRRSMFFRAERERSARLALAEAEDITSEVHMRSYWSAVVHDHVLSVLAEVVALPDGRLPNEVRSDASYAAGRLAQPSVLLPCRVGEFANWVAAAASATLPAAVVTSDLTDRTRLLPGQVAAAMLAAGLESLRNAARHADRSAPVLVTVSDDAMLRLVVRDGGPGFDPSRVSPSRLGLRVAVGERMASVGGQARWYSAPGSGTTVAISWQWPT